MQRPKLSPVKVPECTGDLLQLLLLVSRKALLKASLQIPALSQFLLLLSRA